MGESNLDWKKVFKEILGSPSDRENPKEIPEECKDFFYLPPHLKLIETNSSKRSDKPHNNFSGKRSFRNENRHTNLFASSTDEKCSSNFIGNGKVPEWNKVFKEILGGKSDLKTQVVQERIPSKQTPAMPWPTKAETCHNYMALYRKKQLLGEIHDPKISEEEREVRKLFARARLFKPPYNPHDFGGISRDNFKCDEDFEVWKKARQNFLDSQFFKRNYRNINDLAGAGIDLFKHQDGPCLAEQLLSEENEYLFDDSISNQEEPLKGSKKASKKIIAREEILNAPAVECTESWDDKISNQEDSVPLKGFIANMKMLTREDILNAPVIECTESWDDDLLF